MSFFYVQASEICVRASRNQTRLAGLAARFKNVHFYPCVIHQDEKASGFDTGDYRFYTFLAMYLQIQPFIAEDLMKNSGTKNVTMSNVG
jgi:hypothetical protein